jgi:WD40 repeat protein
VTGDAKRNILLWDLFTYQYSLIPVRFPRFRDDPWENETTLAHETVRSLQFTSDGQRLIFLASSAEGDLHICHFDPVYKHLMRQKTFPHGSVDLALSPNGKMLATIVVEPGRGPVQDIYVYDLESFQLLHIFPQIDEDCYCLLAFSPDRQCLTSCKDNGLVDIFSLDSFDRIASFATHPGLSSHATDPIGGLDWSKTGFIATGGASVFDDVFLDRPDYTIKIWKVE